jgi:hypothetical protein
VGTIFYEAGVVCGGFSAWKLSILAALLSGAFILFCLLFVVIGVVKYFKIWKLAYPILDSYDNNAEPIPFSEYSMRGKIQHIFPVCGIWTLVGGLLFMVLSGIFGWAGNSETARLFVYIVIFIFAVMIPLVGIKGKVFSSCDFLIHIHRREKIRNAKKESKNHK